MAKGNTCCSTWLKSGGDWTPNSWSSRRAAISSWAWRCWSRSGSSLNRHCFKQTIIACRRCRVLHTSWRTSEQIEWFSSLLIWWFVSNGRCVAWLPGRENNERTCEQQQRAACTWDFAGHCETKSWQMLIFQSNEIQLLNSQERHTRAAASNSKKPCGFTYKSQFSKWAPLSCVCPVVRTDR